MDGTRLHQKRRLKMKTIKDIPLAMPCSNILQIPASLESRQSAALFGLQEGVTKAKVWNLDFIGYFADSHLALVNGARWSPPPVPEKVEGASSPQATGAGSVVRAVLAPAATPPHPPVMPSPK